MCFLSRLAKVGDGGRNINDRAPREGQYLKGRRATRTDELPAPPPPTHTHQNVLIPGQCSTKKIYEGPSFVYKRRVYSFILASDTEHMFIK